MNARQSGSQHEVAPAGRTARNKRAVLLLGLTVVIGLLAGVFVRPRVGGWLEVRWAYQDLSSSDEDARTYAVRQLRKLGKETESELIALLHHPDRGVRAFAASELAHRTPMTDDIIEAFLIALESNQHAAEIGDSAPNLFFKHAEEATGPLTETDRRMITWLTPQLDATNPDRGGSAAWALTAFVNRDPSLREPLAAYLKKATFSRTYFVLREMADRDPSMRDQYVDLLFSGLASSVYNDQMNALYGLTHMKNKPDDLGSRLEARRVESADPEEISRIDQVLQELRKKDAEQPSATSEKSMPSS